MAVPEEEQARELSEAERRRLDRFEETSANLIAQGYRRVDLMIGIVKANVIALVAAVPLFIACIVLFALMNLDAQFGFSGFDWVMLAVAYVVLIVVHELVHGFTWSFFTGQGFKAIEFGFMKAYFTPYCTCGVPLPKGPYILGALMPLIVLGIIPTVVALCVGSWLLLILGLVMIVSAAGDVLIVIAVLRYKTDAAETLIYDHPTQAGCVVFER